LSYKLGSPEAREGRFTEARRTFSAAEALLREIGDQREPTRLLCARGACERLTVDLREALTILAEAEALAETIGAKPGSAVRREIGGLRGILR
jgi:hypothetical protein